MVINVPLAPSFTEGVRATHSARQGSVHLVSVFLMRALRGCVYISYVRPTVLVLDTTFESCIVRSLVYSTACTVTTTIVITDSTVTASSTSSVA